VKKYKDHRTCANVRRVEAGGRAEVKKRGRRKGSKGSRRINPELWSDLGGGQDGKIVDLLEGEEFELHCRAEVRAQGNGPSVSTSVR
jgi:hypothetical protein